MLQPGDAECPNGDSALSFGLDDGTGGGTAGNGELEAGEVRSTQNVCNGAMPYYPANVTPPSGPVGTSNAPIDVSGGSGGQGMNGGAISLFTTNEGSQYLSSAGSIFISGNLSANGGTGSDNNGGAAGQVRVYIEPSGISRGESIELLGYEELRANGGRSTSSSSSYGGQIELYNELTSLPSEGSGPGGPTVNTSKLTARVGDGFYASHGGQVRLRTQTSFAYEQANEFVSNSGTIDVSGGASASDSAGYGGQVELDGIAGVENSGRIISNGGAAAGYSGGGPGGYISLYSSEGISKNSGALTANGGTGNQYGGSGGEVFVDAEVSVNNSGAVTANGGNATSNGGVGGSITINHSQSNPATSTGALSVAGGSGTNPGRAGTLIVDGKEVAQ